MTVAECCFSSLGRKAIGADVNLDTDSVDAFLFGETPSRVVVSFPANHLDRVAEIVGDHPFELIGSVGGQSLKVSINETVEIDVDVRDIEQIWSNALDRIVE